MQPALDPGGKPAGLPPASTKTGHLAPGAAHGWSARWLLAALFQLATLCGLAAAQPVTNFPAAHWDRVAHPETLGWATNKLAEAHACAQSIGSAALFVVHQGKVVDDWGATTNRFNVHSIRKSFLSALIGSCVASGTIRLTNTLEQLGVDDNEPKLTPAEKQATVADLLKARSGIYHPALYETEAMKARRPARGSHAPGSFYYYNNWDFNALGTIYEQAAGMSVFAAFEQHLARPLQMEDFRLEDGQYVRGSDSIHPAYTFRMTARDMARFGLLFLHQGRWGDRQVVPADWVAESTRAYSAVAATNGPVYAGYGYLWWTDWQGHNLENVTLPPGTFSARGAGGHYILIAPALDLVIVHRVDTDKKDGPRVDRPEFGTLVKLLLQAMPKGAEISSAPAAKPTPEALDGLVPTLMTRHHVPGVAIVGIENRRVAWERFYGFRRAGQPEPVDARTVFEAASMTKLLMAYAALKLVEQGKLDLDRSLAEYLDKPYLPDEPRHRQITARMVLSHTTGFPNWRTNGWEKGGPLPLRYDPGTRFTYSGEGFLYLQRVVEHITDTPIQSYMQKTLLGPLQMTNSSLVWEDRFSLQAAAGHDAQGKPLANRKHYRDANVAYSLYCPAEDYAQLLLEMMAEDRSAPHSLSARSLDAMLTRTSVAEGRKPVARGGVRRFEPMYYGLGWAIDTTATGDRIHHSGSNGTGFRCYCEFDRRRGTGLVIMANAVNGARLWEDIMLAVGEP